MIIGERDRLLEIELPTLMHRGGCGRWGWWASARVWGSYHLRTCGLEQHGQPTATGQAETGKGGIVAQIGQHVIGTPSGMQTFERQGALGDGGGNRESTPVAALPRRAS
jgi:hypothetical protein